MRPRALIGRAALVAAMLGLSAIMAPGTAHAESGCNAGGAPRVRVVFSGVPWNDALAHGVLEHLRAGLTSQGFDVCLAEELDEHAAVATIELRQAAGEHVAATIEIRDGVTEKRVARDIDLGALPPDGRALAVGAAADELLRASWLELSLADAPKPSRPPPPEAVRAAKRSLGDDGARSLATVAVSMEGYSGRFLLLGGALAFRRYLGRRLALEVELGVAEARPFASENGTIHGSALSASGSLLLDVARAGPFRTSLAASMWVANLTVRGAPSGAGTGKTESAVAVFARAGVALTLDVTSSFALAARASAGLPVRAVSANDAGRESVAASGVEWSAAAGPAVVF